MKKQSEFLFMPNELFTCARAPLPETTRAPHRWTRSPMQAHNSLTLPTCTVEGGSILSCISKCAWVPINCVWEGTWGPRPESWELEGTAQWLSCYHTLPDTYLTQMFPQICWSFTLNLGNHSQITARITARQVCNRVMVTFKPSIILNLKYFHLGGLCHKTLPKPVAETKACLFPKHAVICHLVFLAIFQDFSSGYNDVTVMIWSIGNQCDAQDLRIEVVLQRQDTT